MGEKYSLAQLVERFGGRVAGDENVQIGRIATLQHATGGDISFLTNSKYTAQLQQTQASAVILSEANADLCDIPRILCTNPYVYFARVSALLNPEAQHAAGIHPSAVVADSAVIDASATIAATAVVEAGAVVAAGCYIGPGCYIGAEVKLGRDSYLNPRVTIYHGCILGERVRLHSGCVIGADGFGLAMDEGRWLKVPQVGAVVIADDVEVGANTTIDRGALNNTVIGEGVKIDNQVQIAHNVEIGAHTAIAGCAAIAGSTTIGRYCLISGSARIIGHLQIADRVEIAAHSLVSKSIRNAGVYSGVYPLDSKDNWRRNAVHLRRLDQWTKRIKQLEKQLKV